MKKQQHKLYCDNCAGHVEYVTYCTGTIKHVCDKCMDKDKKGYFAARALHGLDEWEYNERLERMKEWPK